MTVGRLVVGRRVLAPAVVTALAAVVVSGFAAGLWSQAAAASSVRVAVVDDAFDPRVARISAGDTVVWSWSSANANPHTVTALNGSFDSDRRCGAGDPASCRAPGRTFQVTFSEPGTYQYRCKVHLTMLGTVDVAPAPAPAPPAAPPATDKPSESPTKRPIPPLSTAPPPPPPSPSQAVRGSAQNQPAPVSRRAYRGRFAVVPAPERPYVSGAEDPSVAPPLARQSFSPFPSPSDTVGGLAVDIATGQRWPPRDLLVGLAAAAVLASAFTFGKVVLFGPPWD